MDWRFLAGAVEVVVLKKTVCIPHWAVLHRAERANTELIPEAPNH